MIFLPLFFTILPLAMLFFTNIEMDSASDVSTADVPVEFLAVCGEGMSGGECVQVYLINQFLLMFMMMPVIIPVTIASYSIVGEKATHSLEPLLATPISTMELLAGKSLAACSASDLCGMGILWAVYPCPAAGWGNRSCDSLYRRSHLAACSTCGRSIDGCSLGQLFNFRVLTRQ